MVVHMFAETADTPRFETGQQVVSSEAHDADMTGSRTTSTARPAEHVESLDADDPRRPGSAAGSKNVAHLPPGVPIERLVVWAGRW
jgi:hypothetical protein